MLSLVYLSHNCLNRNFLHTFALRSIRNICQVDISLPSNGNREVSWHSDKRACLVIRGFMSGVSPNPIKGAIVSMSDILAMWWLSVRLFTLFCKQPYCVWRHYPSTFRCVKNVELLYVRIEIDKYNTITSVCIFLFWRVVRCIYWLACDVIIGRHEKQVHSSGDKKITLGVFPFTFYTTSLAPSL